jgi:cysteinyl-tRNA synthetase
MSEELLGESFDIHGGGLDLIFPHHENEIAQSECAHEGKPFVKYWLHNAFVTVDGEKMAKSEGNFRTIRDVLAEAPGEAARLAMLTAHYRDPLDWTGERLANAKQNLDRFYLALRSVESVKAEAGELPHALRAALEDDLNTPLALAALHESVAELNKAESVQDKARIKGGLLAAGAVLGLLQQPPEAWLKMKRELKLNVETGHYAITGGKVELKTTNPKIDKLVQERNEARKAKDFARADKIRADLAAEGIILEDRSDGTTEWRRG